MSSLPITHGTVNGYVNYGCRCNECRIANTLRMRKWRIATRKNLDLAAAAGARDVRMHGTRSSYVNYGCRCNECRDANSRYRRERRARRAS